MKFEYLLDIDEPFCLVLSDCATQHLEKYMKKMCETMIRVECVQIQSGKGYNNWGWEKLENLEYCLLFGGWANAASVIDDPVVWENRMAVIEQIVKRISESGCNLLMIDRPGQLDRYWVNEEFAQHCEKGKLGVPIHLAKKLGWIRQDPVGQIARRIDYYERLEKVSRIIYRTTYFDLMNCPVAMLDSAEVHHDVVNSAPWHYTEELYKKVAQTYYKFMNDYLDNDEFIKWKATYE
jgi:hypothetical protein